MGNEAIETVTTKHGRITIYGCWDHETPEDQYSFYDLYDAQGICLNLGNPFWYEEGRPTIQVIEDFLDDMGDR